MFRQCATALGLSLALAGCYKIKSQGCIHDKPKEACKSLDAGKEWTTCIEHDTVMYMWRCADSSPEYKAIQDTGRLPMNLLD